MRARFTTAAVIAAAAALPTPIAGAQLATTAPDSPAAATPDLVAQTTSLGAVATQTVLTVAGNTLLVPTPMSEELQGVLCTGNNSCVTVVYPSSAVGQGPLDQGEIALDAAIHDTPGDKVVFTYSQGGLIATSWLQKHAGATDAPPASQLIFVLAGNPQRGLGGLAPTTGVGPATPTDTQYTVVDVAREYDAESDWPTNPWNGLAVANALAAYVTVHMDYTDVDLDAPDNLVQQVGNTTYVLVPTKNLPLLEPLRQIGLGSVADQLNGPLKAIVDQGYNRTGYRTLGSDPAAQAVIDRAIGTSTASSLPSAPQSVGAQQVDTLAVGRHSSEGSVGVPAGKHAKTEEATTTSVTRSTGTGGRHARPESNTTDGSGPASDSASEGSSDTADTSTEGSTSSATDDSDTEDKATAGGSSRDSGSHSGTDD